MIIRKKLIIIKIKKIKNKISEQKNYQDIKLKNNNNIIFKKMKIIEINQILKYND